MTINIIRGNYSDPAFQGMLSALSVAAETGGTRNLNTTVAVTAADARKAEEKAREIPPEGNKEPVGENPTMSDI